VRVFLWLVLGLLFASVAFQANYLATLAYFCLVFLLLLYLWMRSIPGRLTYRRSFGSRLLYDERGVVTLTLQNRGLLPIPWLFVQEPVPPILGHPTPFAATIWLPPRSSRQLTYTAHGRQRGRYLLGPLTLTYGDLFGFWERHITEATGDTLVVYPQILPVERLQVPTRTPLGSAPAQSPFAEDPSRSVGVRDYEIGDSVRRMHWSATAHAGRLQVKKFETVIVARTVIVLDLDPASYDAGRWQQDIEAAIVAAASHANRINRLRQQFGLLTNGEDPLAGPSVPHDAPAERAEVTGNGVLLPPGRGGQHFTDILELLARIEQQRRLPLALLLQHRLRDLGWNSTLIVVTGWQTQDLGATLHRMKSRGHAVLQVRIGAPPAPHGAYTSASGAEDTPSDVATTGAYRG